MPSTSGCVSRAANAAAAGDRSNGDRRVLQMLARSLLAIGACSSIGCSSDSPGEFRPVSGALDATAANDGASGDGSSPYADGAVDRGLLGDEPAKDASSVAIEAEASVDASDGDVALSDGDAGAVVIESGADTAADGSVVVEPIHFYGRWNRLADRAITVNSGSHVRAQFQGTGLTARFDVSRNTAPLPTLAWRIDQGAWQEGEVAAALTLGQTLPVGLHEVWLLARGFDERQSRWSPPLAASLTFLGFDVAGGSVQTSARPVQPRIEFLGDSITEGVAVFGDRAGMATASWHADGRIAYPCQTALALDAEWRQVGFGGQGVTVAGSGGVPKAADAFGWMYSGVPRDGWQPDIVVINQGTNDGSAPSATFRPAYAAYLAAVRVGYPSSRIVALRPFGGAHAVDIQAEVASRVGAGDSRIFFVDTTGWLSAADFTDGTHPNAGGSAKAAQLLAPELRKHL